MTLDTQPDPVDAATEPLGQRLSRARSAQGLSIDAVAARMRLPVAVIEAMERSDWERLGAPVFVRGRVGSYARLLGLPPNLVEEICPEQAQPPLVSMARTSRVRQLVDRSARRAVYIVITAAIALPVIWLATHDRLTSSRVALTPLDPAPFSAPASSSAAGGEPATTDGAAAQPGSPAPDPATAATEEDAPVVASLAPFYPKASDAAGRTTAASVEPNGLVLQFEDESWVEVYGRDGRRLEHGLLPAGSERRYASGQVARVTLGNADAVQVSNGGEVVDLTPYRRANVARFTVSSDGRMTPAGG